jgi:hypothetical protein
MLTGKQTFTGETVTDVPASVVKEHPAIDARKLHMAAVGTGASASR